MEKTEMILQEEKFMKEQGKSSWVTMAHAVEIGFDEVPTPEFLTYLVKKADAYDRLMSGGKKTLKEWANWLGTNIAVDEKGNGCVSKNPLEFHPLGDGYKVAGYWTIRAGYSYLMFNIPAYLIDFDGDWTTSLTLPDGWEEK